MHEPIASSAKCHAAAGAGRKANRNEIATPIDAAHAKEFRTVCCSMHVTSGATDINPAYAGTHASAHICDEYTSRPISATHSAIRVAYECARATYQVATSATTACSNPEAGTACV